MPWRFATELPSFQADPSIVLDMIKTVYFTCLNKLIVYLNYLMHGVSEKCLKTPALARRLVLQARQQCCKWWRLLALSQHLQTVVVVPHVLLVDAQHW